ncbi:hypothetical protein HPB50_018657 [Hyalomma asiaticum]|uniref:Uncharacterized protein n=1 Tax=Hyalomma asiaticum TaxID=266040 RepID=A0ACB7SIT5_HYAAI|nr:hypothetical protein HPB50_018657 [Hyalomma asiaticum]
MTETMTGENRNQNCFLPAAPIQARRGGLRASQHAFAADGDDGDYGAANPRQPVHSCNPPPPLPLLSIFLQRRKPQGLGQRKCREARCYARFPSDDVASMEPRSLRGPLTGTIWSAEAETTWRLADLPCRH